MSTQAEIEPRVLPAEEKALGGRRRPWESLSALLVTALVFGLYTMVSTAVIAGFVVYEKLGDPAAELEFLVEQALQNGLAICLSVVIAGSCGVAATLYFSHRRSGQAYRSYLALQPVPVTAVAFWTSLTILFVVLFQAATYFIEFQSASGIYSQILRTADNLALFVVALVVIPALFEEILFRGFMFRGLQRSRLGNTGTILVTSFCWSVIHLQYSLDLIVVLFLLGVFFGIARLRSGSTLVTIVMHGTFNLVSVIGLLLS